MLFASIGKIFIIAGGLGAKLLFYEVLFYLKQTILNVWTKFVPKRTSRPNEHYHCIQHIWISLGTFFLIHEWLFNISSPIVRRDKDSSLKKESFVKSKT